MERERTDGFLFCKGGGTRDGGKFDFCLRSCYIIRMQKVCTLSGRAFEVAKEDVAFYEKMRVPTPMLCPQERLRRRMSFRNERQLYQRKCDITGKNIISIFAPDSPFKVCDKNYWYSHEFEPLNYGRDFDFSRPFFDQFEKLLREIPLPSLRVENSENCEYNNDMSDSKNCYMCFRTHKSSDMLYTYRGNNSVSCTDCMQVVENSELLYECIECVTCYGSHHLHFCSNCHSSAFLSHCQSCSDCFLCTGLQQKRYCFLNQQLTKEQYEEKLKSFHLGSSKTFQQALDAFEKLCREDATPRSSIVKSEDCTGRDILNSKNCFECYEVKNVHDGRYLFNVMKHKDAMDEYTGGRDSELIYECTSASGCYNVKFCMRASNARDTDYSFFIQGGQNLFGCVGLRQKKHCILNKEYSAEAYFALREKIVAHMQKTGEWGEYFPSRISPFAYNETVANDYFPLSKEEVLKRGWRWREKDKKEYRPQTYEIPDDIEEVGDDILNEVLACEATGKNYKIQKAELDFYRKMQLPIPRLCPEERHRRRLIIQSPKGIMEGK